MLLNCLPERFFHFHYEKISLGVQHVTGDGHLVARRIKDIDTVDFYLLRVERDAHSVLDARQLYRDGAADRKVVWYYEGDELQVVGDWQIIRG